MPKPASPSPTLKRSLWADFNKRMAETRAHLARVEDLILRKQIRFIYVPKVKVRAHTRSAHWRPYVPPLRRTDR